MYIEGRCNYYKALGMRHAWKSTLPRNTQHPSWARAWTIVVPVPMISCILGVATDFTSQASIYLSIDRSIEL
jgi:hypothetical protein